MDEHVQADPSLCSSHRSYCRFCRALAEMVCNVCAVRRSLFTVPPLGVIRRLCSVTVALPEEIIYFSMILPITCSQLNTKI